MVHFKNTPEICYENSPIVPDTDFIIFHNIHVVQVAYVSKQKKKSYKQFRLWQSYGRVKTWKLTPIPFILFILSFYNENGKLFHIIHLSLSFPWLFLSFLFPFYSQMKSTQHVAKYSTHSHWHSLYMLVCVRGFFLVHF